MFAINFLSFVGNSLILLIFKYEILNLLLNEWLIKILYSIIYIYYIKLLLLLVKKIICEIL